MQYNPERVYILNPAASLPTLNDAFNLRVTKLASLAQAALSDDFFDYSKEITYHYLVVISDFVDELRELQNAITYKTKVT